MVIKFEGIQLALCKIKRSCQNGSLFVGKCRGTIILKCLRKEEWGLPSNDCEGMGQ